MQDNMHAQTHPLEGSHFVLAELCVVGLRASLVLLVVLERLLALRLDALDALVAAETDRKVTIR